jgi:hypothetical protein
MELDLQSLFGLHVHSCTHWLKPRNRNPPPPHLGSYTRVLLVSQDRRHLFVTPWVYCIRRDEIWPKGLECLTANAKLATVLFSITASSDSESWGSANESVMKKIQDCTPFLAYASWAAPLGAAGSVNHLQISNTVPSLQSAPRQSWLKYYPG